MTKCGRHGPDTSNVCTNDQIGQGDTKDYELPRFCAPDNDFFSGTSTRKKFCDRIGGGGEWEYDKEGPDDCHYDMEDDKSGYSIGSGCCNFSNCGVTGAKTKCKRKSYNGLPLNCCFRDLAWNKSNQYCYQTGSEKSTCPPNYRDMTGKNCQERMIGYCTADDVVSSTKDWIEAMNDRWSPAASKSCQYVMNRNLFGNPNTPGLTSGVPLNPNLFTNNEGFRSSQTLMSEVFKAYGEHGFQVGSVPGYPGYDEFQHNYLFPICATIPGLCEQSLSGICGTITTDVLINEPQLVPWCGCYMEDIEYQRYINEFQVDKECTPTCARQGNIPLANQSGFGVLPCKQSLCIIDDVTISLEQSSVGEGINFSQFCGACGGYSQGSATSGSMGAQADASSASCRCIINGLNIDAASSAIGGGIDLSQICGADAECYRPNPDSSGPPVVSVPCDAPPHINPNDNPETELEKLEDEYNTFRRNVIIVLVILSIIAFIFILYLISLYGNNTNPKVIYPNPDKLALEALLQPKPPAVATTSIADRYNNQHSYSTNDFNIGQSGSIANRANSVNINQDFNNIGNQSINHHTNSNQNFSNIGSQSINHQPSSNQNFSNIGGQSINHQPSSNQYFGNIGGGSITNR